MNKRLKRIYRIYHQLDSNIWGNIEQYKKLSNKDKVSTRHKLSRISIINGQAQKLSINSKYEVMRQIKKYYLNVSKRFMDKVINNKDYYIKKYSNILNILESRLDTILYRSNWASSLSEARQITNHGYICINGKNVFQSNILITVGDIVSVDRDYIRYLQDKMIDKIEANRFSINVPEYIEVNYTTMEAILVYYPESHEIPIANISNINEIYNYIC